MEPKVKKKKVKKRKREGKYPEIADVLRFLLIINRGLCVSGPMLKVKAQEFTQQIGIKQFITTDGWLIRFMKRHDVKLKRAHGEKASADTSGPTYFGY